MDQDLDEKFMHLALKEAQEARCLNEIPVGAVLTDESHSVISKAHNLKESTQNPLSHAEILVIEQASQKLNSWRLLNTTLYVTLEPCVMCMGAILSARIEKVVFGTADPKAGGLVSLYGIGQDGRLNHQVKYSQGILQKECSDILKDFFKSRR